MNVSLTEQDLVNIKMTVLTLERQEIARNIDPRRFFGHLRAKYIFDERDCDEIRSVSSRIGSAEAFVDILKRKGAKGYDEFCAALMKDRTQLFLLQQMTQTLEQLRARVLDKKRELALAKKLGPPQAPHGSSSSQSSYPLPPPNSHITYPIGHPPQGHPPQTRPTGNMFPPPSSEGGPPQHMVYHNNNGGRSNTLPAVPSYAIPSSSNYGGNNGGNNTGGGGHNKQLRKVNSRTSNSDDYPTQYIRHTSYPFGETSYDLSEHSGMMPYSPPESIATYNPFSPPGGIAPQLSSPGGMTGTHYNNIDYNRSQSNPAAVAAVSPTSSIPFHPILTSGGRPISPNAVFGGGPPLPMMIPNYPIGFDTSSPQGQKLMCRGIDDEEEHDKK